MPEEQMTVEGIIRRAIQVEENAYSFYTGASEMVKLPHVKDMLNELAGEEVKHKEKLEDLLAGDTEQIVATGQSRKIQDLKLADYLVTPPLDEDATIQDILMIAMQREKNAHEFYNLMAGLASEAAKDLFQFLAQEELRHKNKEVLYDDIVYREF